MDQPTINIQSFLSELLIAKRFSPLRHVIIVTIVGLISFNQNTYVYMPYRVELGSNLYYISFFTTAMYLIVGYTHLYTLVNKFLFQKKYAQYFIWSVFITFSAVAFLWLQNYLVHIIYHIPNVNIKTSFLLFVVEGLSDFITFFLCFTGLSITAFLKHRLYETEIISHLEKTKIQSEVKTLKQQATPELLFGSLHTAGEQAEKKPEKASDIIMNLSTVLRYQLYEGDKKQVLLKTETEYIKNYLHLISIISENNFIYEIKIDAKLNFAFIPPLLYTPLINNGLENLESKNEKNKLILDFQAKENQLIFKCSFTINREEKVINLGSFADQLDLLYGENYNILIEKNENMMSYILYTPLTSYAKNYR